LWIIDYIKKKSSLTNEAPRTKATSKEEIYNLPWQAIGIMNEKLDRLTNLSQNLENKLNGILKRWLNMKIY